MAVNTHSVQQWEDFGRAVATSSVVMTRRLSPFEKFVMNDNLALTTFYQQFRSGERTPEDNQWDRARLAADGTINPLIHEDLHFAALSLDGVGADYYGGYHITLEEEAIQHRTSVFEENPILFLERHQVIAGRSPPVGYRAVWQSRDQLAKAKLQSRITSETTPDDFSGILLSAGATADADFLEVHIYGSLHRDAISKVIVTTAPKGGEKHIWRELKRVLEDLGVEVKEQ